MIGFWKTLAFVSNALLFLIAGLQLHAVARAAFAHDSWNVVAGEDDALAHLARDAAATAEVVTAQRNAIIEMRERGEIDNVVLRELQSRLDFAAQRA